VLASFLGEDGVPDALAVRGPDGAPRRGSVPSYASPESAALALSRAVAYAEWRARPQGTVTELREVDLPAARAVLSPLPEDGSWLAQADASALLATVGIRVWPTVLVRGEDDAVRVAHEQGWPVVLKAASEQWRHRLDVGAVRLHLADEAELRAAWQSVTALTGESAAYVQPLARAGRVDGGAPRAGRDGRAAAVPAARRRGGRPARRPVTRTLPLTDADAAELVRAIRGAELLTGRAGGAPADVEALEELLLRVARVGGGPAVGRRARPRPGARAARRRRAAARRACACCRRAATPTAARGG
jgi:acetyltransferase